LVDGAVLVFDMDGVLVDPTESYRETIIRTVEHFTGKRITHALIQDYKNGGGWNNDWALSQRICSDLGVEVSYDAVAEYFEDLFLNEGMIHRERWLPRSGLIQDLGRDCTLAIFTGRPQLHASLTLKREGCFECFHIVTSDDVENHKPHPEGLLKIAALHPGRKLVYVGDTVDDARSARAAGVPFIGIAAAEVPNREKLIGLFEAEGAVRILENVNEIR